ncbi:MAG: cell envelope integrity protein TolA [Rudaea sp.]|nr:cell envelope integrity protein TolA [Rudaea sp.]
MESFRDKARAFFLALLVHLGVAGSLLISLLWTQAARPISLPGPVIEAELVGISAAPKPRAASRPKPAPPKPAEQPPEPAKPPEPKPEPPTQPQRNDQIEREKVAEMATEKAEQAQRAEEERHRQEQVLLEQQQQQERDRQKLLDEVKRQREAAAKQVKLAKEKLTQMQDLQKQAKPLPTQAVPESDQAKTGTNGKDDSLQAQYFAAIQNAVTTNWLRPDNTQAGVRCMLRIVQIPGGDVIGVEIGNPCNADPLTRNSIEQAVKRAAPLPYKGYEKEFQRQINFNFTYDG